MSDVKKKQKKGVVVSDKPDKSVVVEVSEFIKHPRYQKYYTESKKYMAHDPDNAYSEGDEVVIEECRPMSKKKRFRVITAQ